MTTRVAYPKAYDRKLLRERRCLACVQPNPDPSHRRCPSCMEKHRQDQRERTQGRREDGVCVRCRAETTRFRNCLPCRLEQNARNQKRRAEQRRAA